MAFSGMISIEAKIKCMYFKIMHRGRVITRKVTNGGAQRYAQRYSQRYATKLTLDFMPHNNNSLKSVFRSMFSSIACLCGVGRA